MLQEKINLTKTLDGVKAELIGCWLWVDGETKKHKEALKQAGFMYAPKKHKWYYHEEKDGKKFYRSKPLDMEEIKRRYETTKIA